ncbi:hypothetical protein THMIRHAS_04590 [Thiosulfatimonas sediminis]|uniref:Methyltransferase domain-containing protein n=1 Tax=Thiosulfatimonas sediminis TaxID=2675054 RepID=A0A6F8PSM3_9GAMM|nr:class I SAM-dependent methyltransferase [Thiosulfatimonas sediminis]BBP45086.1 hypothetical protein THMIRHAS_04590 [Thiosulfatimonas sediminis]
MQDNFYRHFEDRFRGSRATIKQRLSAYLPLIRQQKTLCLDQEKRQMQVLDLGCGRGEWLELLGDEDVVALGVDKDAQMLQACRDQGLDVQESDIFAFLESGDATKYDVITAFHVVEHLTFDELQRLIQLAKERLNPQGILCFETPNPENISVASNSFHLDPTHYKPLPPTLLSFLFERFGFAVVTILRLDNYRPINASQQITLNDVLHFVSPDYAVIGVKGRQVFTQVEVLEKMQAVQGHSLNDLAMRFDQQVQEKAQQEQMMIREMRQEIAALQSEQILLKQDIQARELNIIQLIWQKLKNTPHLFFKHKR